MVKDQSPSLIVNSGVGVAGGGGLDELIICKLKSKLHWHMVKEQSPSLIVSSRGRGLDELIAYFA